MCACSEIECSMFSEATVAVAAAGSGMPKEEKAPEGEAAALQVQALMSAHCLALVLGVGIGGVTSGGCLWDSKGLAKANSDVMLAGQEAIFILARVLELFVETIAKNAYCCAQQGKRKTPQRRDLDNAIEAVNEFTFLEGTLD
ncbi:DNA polymerase epsilon subunit 4-like [Rattus norvegicus]|uniref:DNA polymerase epsilon subunit 4-like n=1 Tax=Rattus norvegicus TaxID=10116 RepID=UPI0000DA23DD